MGRNKAFLTLKGRMFLWIIIEALSPLFEDLILVTREPGLYTGFPVHTVTDLFPDKGPLTGILSGLAASKDSLNFCVACDMPFIRTALVQYMMNTAYDCDALIPCTGTPGPIPDRIEPLHAVYHKRCIPQMERHIREGRQSLHELIGSLNIRYLHEQESARFDPDRNSFRNINRPDEYDRLVFRSKKAGNGTVQA